MTDQTEWRVENLSVDYGGGPRETSHWYAAQYAANGDFLRTIGTGDRLTKTQANLIAAAPAKERLCEELADALEKLLPVAQHFEKQSSRGTGGRRGYAVFCPARAALKAAGRAPG